MPVIKCPSCRATYDPGVDDELADMPEGMSLKVVCPSCGQWLRLPERETIDPPDVSAKILREMMAQSRLISEGTGNKGSGSRRASRPRDDEDEDDRPRRRRSSRRDDDDRPRARHYDDERDDFDDYPRQSRSSTSPLGIIAMIAGILSLVVAIVGWCCCGYFGSAVAILLGLAAVIMGFIGRSQPGSQGMAVTGIITGFGGLLIGLIMTILLIVGVAWLQANQGKFGPGVGGPAPPNQPAPRKF